MLLLLFVIIFLESGLITVVEGVRWI